MKSQARVKLMHIGLKIVAILTAKSGKLLFFENKFKDVFVRNLMSPKGQLYEVSVEIKNEMIKVLDKGLDKKLAFKLLKDLFGPSGLSGKKHMDLMVAFSEKIDSEQVQDYIENYLTSMFQSQDSEQINDENKQKNFEKQLFALSQLSNITGLFK
jgi:hypothetical protein